MSTVNPKKSFASAARASAAAPAPKPVAQAQPSPTPSSTKSPVPSSSPTPAQQSQSTFDKLQQANAVAAQPQASESKSAFILQHLKPGMSVEFRDSLGVLTQGTVVGLDANLNMIALDSDSEFALHSCANMAEFKVISSEAKALPAFVGVDRATIAERATKSLSERQKYLAKFGKNVTPEAQLIFDALSKTMPCSWDSTTIVVVGVRISAPYTPNDCQSDNPESLERLKHVLTKERKKLGLN